VNLSEREVAALEVFRDYRVATGEMFCFTGPVLEKHRDSLNLLVGKELLVKEQFSGGYSMTGLGHRALVASRRG
jgi:hypothetical protein